MVAIGLAALAILLATMGALTLRRHGEPRRTAMQRLIRATYRLSAWLYWIACGLDRGYREYRAGLAAVQIAPENEV